MIPGAPSDRCLQHGECPLALVVGDPHHAHHELEVVCQAELPGPAGKRRRVFGAGAEQVIDEFELQPVLGVLEGAFQQQGHTEHQGAAFHDREPGRAELLGNDEGGEVLVARDGGHDGVQLAFDCKVHGRPFGRRFFGGAQGREAPEVCVRCELRQRLAHGRD